jgi:hypothetical protein
MRKGISGSALLLGCSVAFCSATDTKPSVIPAIFKHGHIEFKVGGYWNNQGKSQHIDIQGLIGDDFTVNHSRDSNVLVGLGYFIDSQDLGFTKLRYGITGFFLPKTYVSGVVVQENLFSNLSFQYHTTSYPIYFGAKANIPSSISSMTLTMDAGIGPNFMHTGGFEERSLDGDITLPDSIFSGRTTTTFSATIGLGIQIEKVLGDIPLECGYRFFYLGQGHFNRNTDQVINTLQTGSVYANALLCTVHI